MTTAQLLTGQELTPPAAERNSNTDSVIIVAVIECPPHDELSTICPLTCSSITVDTGNTLNWSTFTTRNYQKIRIYNQSRTLLAQIVLERTMVSGVLYVRNMANLICNNTQMVSTRQIPAITVSAAMAIPSGSTLAG